jgi:uncharacterized protein
LRILYLHGFASGPTSGKAKYFQRRFAERGVTLEIPNLVEGDFENLTITGQIDVINRAARDEPVALIGSSMGGYLAALYASAHPEVTKLVLMAPAFQMTQRWDTRQWKETGRLEVFHYVENRNAYIGYGLIEDAVKYDPAPDFSQPGLIFHGIYDTVVPAAYSEDFAATHANVTLRLLNSDHQLTDVMDVMWAEVSQFLG